MRRAAPTRFILLLSCFFSAPGCTWIGQAAYERKLESLDEDGDGEVRKTDCDDEDPDINHAAVEIPYDGLDSNCDGVDLIDVDLDGFPGISAEAYAALGSDVPYPPDMEGKPIDCADDPAVQPDAARIYPDPSKTIEVPYDAIDGDCQKDNDFDVDGDGFMPDTVTIEGVVRPTGEVFAEYLATWDIPEASTAGWAPPGHPAPVVGDCDDTDDSIHPENAIAEVYYDGIDRDCDHHNDFDLDGDCFMPPAAEPLYAAYVQRFYGNQPPPFCVDPDLPFGDCLDAPEPTILSVPDGISPDPADVHPDTVTVPNVDAPYDAIDADCAGDNDFDGDGDAFLPVELPFPVPGDPTVTELMEAYAETWGYTDRIADWAAVNPEAGLALPVEGDCDDGRFDTWPGALELLGDGVDQDCAGDPDLTAWSFGDLSGDFDWTDPTNPEIARLGDTLLVLIGARAGQIPDLQNEFGVALSFSLAAARGGAVPTDPVPPYWKATPPTLQLQPMLDAEILSNPLDVDQDGIPDPVVTTGYSTDNVATGYTHLNVNSLQYFTATDLLTPIVGTTHFVSDSYVTSAVDVIHDPDGYVFAVACAPSWLHATYSLELPPPLVATDEGNAADTCFFDGPVDASGSPILAPLTVCAAGSCEAWTMANTPELGDEGPTEGAWAYGDQDNGWLSLIDGTGAGAVREAGGADLPVFEGKTLLHLDVAYADPNLYAAAVVDAVGGPEVWLAFGPPGNLEEVPLPYEDTSVSGEAPRWVAVYADDDRVAVAVTALTGLPLQDSVGWVFFGPPQ